MRAVSTSSHVAEPGSDASPGPREAVTADEPRRRFGWLLTACSLGLVVVLAALVVPMVGRQTWAGLPAVLRSVSPLDLAVIAAIWIAGLVVHTVALTAAMPPLSHRRALTLSLTGSAVSNVTPLGGAVGVGLNFHMARIWGFTRSDFVVFTFITNLWDVLVKLFVPASILGVLLIRGQLATGPVTTAAFVTAGVSALALVISVAVALNETVARIATEAVQRTVTTVLRLARSRRTVDLTKGFLDVRSSSEVAIRTRWARLTAGQVGYSALLLALLWACLRVTGTGLSPSQVMAAFAVERLLTLSVVTPGGAGVVEVGLAGFLLATGGDPVATISGVLLYRAFTFLLEIPVGGLLLGAWLWLQRRTDRLLDGDSLTAPLTPAAGRTSV